MNSESILDPEDALHRRLEELASLAALGRSVNATLDPEEVIRASHASLSKALRPDAIFLFLRDGDRLVLKNTLPSQDRPRFDEVPEHRIGECLCGLAVRVGRPTYSLDISSDCRCTWEECKKAGVKSFAALPLVHGRETIGAIGLASMTTRDFSAQDRVLEILASQVCAALGNARLYAEAQREIVERRHAEESLRESEESFRGLFDTVGEAIYIQEQDGTFINVNRGVVEMYGYPREVFIGKSPEFLAAPGRNDPSRIQEHISRAFAGEPQRFEFWARRSSGEIFPKDVRLYRGRYFGKDVVVALAVDLTETKRLEEERIEMERRLQHAQRLESLGVLAGGIAHDFNNILQVIVANLSLVQSENEHNPTALGCLESIDASAKRAATLTKQMLAYAGKGRFDVDAVDLSKAVSGMVQLLHAAVSKKARIRLELLPSPPAIRADASEMAQVIMNLIINASEALGDQPGDILLKTGAVDLDTISAKAFFPHSPLPAGRYVTIEVRDTGCGMDEATRERIFDPFFSTKFIGRGLGLSAVQGIVHAHQGGIRVESQSGHGSALTVFLPADEEFQRIRAASVRVLAPSPGLQGTILVVDDEEMVRIVIRATLEISGWRVLEARDGLDAVEIYRQHGAEISLVLLDYKMPRMDGVEAFIELRKMNPRVAAILSSGYTEGEAIAEHGMLGWAGFLQKPYDLRALQAKIRHLLACCPSSPPEGLPG